MNNALVGLFMIQLVNAIVFGLILYYLILINKKLKEKEKGVEND